MMEEYSKTLFGAIVSANDSVKSLSEQTEVSVVSIFSLFYFYLHSNVNRNCQMLATIFQLCLLVNLLKTQVKHCK